ncbi:hypothetical protein MKQ68_19015 [Chitinophaga horti]|uniref:Uncharacterized protein n=1 Tax=Chitinophaga horti TaxID=2920382 RepID=A0ABY6IXR4_9BACT|nr:hypothetical protein [Chitinophaga horti]UYQ92181.1 hypothetical protein MKQ68_19015 [Chitinophaga horti]
MHTKDLPRIRGSPAAIARLESNYQYLTQFRIMTAHILLLSGIALRLLIARREFNRRGPAGLQHHKNFWIALLTVIIETVLKIGANLSIILGLLLESLNYINHLLTR